MLPGWVPWRTRAAVWHPASAPSSFVFPSLSVSVLCSLCWAAVRLTTSGPVGCTSGSRGPEQVRTTGSNSWSATTLSGHSYVFEAVLFSFCSRDLTSSRSNLQDARCRVFFFYYLSLKDATGNLLEMWHRAEGYLIDENIAYLRKQQILSVVDGPYSFVFCPTCKNRTNLRSEKVGLQMLLTDSVPPWLIEGSGLCVRALAAFQTGLTSDIQPVSQSNSEEFKILYHSFFSFQATDLYVVSGNAVV